MSEFETEDAAKHTAVRFIKFFMEERCLEGEARQYKERNHLLKYHVITPHLNYNSHSNWICGYGNTIYTGISMAVRGENKNMTRQLIYLVHYTMCDCAVAPSINHAYYDHTSY